MDSLMRFFRDEQPTDDKNMMNTTRNPSNLTVDTSVMQNYPSKIKSLSSLNDAHAHSPQWSPSDKQTPRSEPSSTPMKTPNHRLTRSPSSIQSSPLHTELDQERVMRRSRSNSECLLLMKQRGSGDLPGPCQEYISNLKTMLAKSEGQYRRHLQQNSYEKKRSMSLHEQHAVLSSSV